MVGSPSKPFVRRLEDLSVLATLLLFTGGVCARADEIFTVRIENVSAKDALKLSNGKTEPVGVAPVLYVIHTNRAPLFTSGEPDRGKGLEALAEDGAHVDDARLALQRFRQRARRSQPAPHTGPREHGVVRPISEVNDGFHYPSVAE